MSPVTRKITELKRKLTIQKSSLLDNPSFTEAAQPQSRNFKQQLYFKKTTQRGSMSFESEDISPKNLS